MIILMPIHYQEIPLLSVVVNQSECKEIKNHHMGFFRNIWNLYTYYYYYHYILCCTRHDDAWYRPKKKAYTQHEKIYV